VLLSNGGALSIQNTATTLNPTLIQPTSLSVAAPHIDLIGGRISAASGGNVAASNISVHATEALTARNASITTTAQDGNGGGIDLLGGHVVLLDHSQVSTSVRGLQNGNGGDIRIQADALVLNAGFIQANTNAPRATGGNVVIDAGLLVHSGVLLSGGDVPLVFGGNGFSVIQAAAPEGISGDITVTAPVLDIAGSLRGLRADLISFATLGKDLCRLSAGSSLTPLSRGGLRPLSAEMIRPESALALASRGSGSAQDGERESRAHAGMQTAWWRCQ
jgi:hypothetical protein